MQRLVTAVVIAILIATFGSGLALAQSSGNFTYGTNANSVTACVLNNDNTGTISGGVQCSLASTGGSCTTSTGCLTGQSCFNPTGGTGAGVCVSSTSGSSCTSDSQCTAPETCVIPTGAASGICGVVGNGLCIGSLKAGIKTSSGNGNAFVIRPSAVIGLLTDVTVGKNSTVNIGTSSALAGVDMGVTVKPLSNQGPVTLYPSYPITYDARFVQISTNLFNVLGALCTTTTGCFISFNESTVSAHSFDWIATGLSSGSYGITAQWTSSLGDFGIANSMTCVGPVNLTVEQNKIFNFNTVNSF
jgi:hypothetical protein